ncbi:MAG: hypothetical protein LUE10_02990, partial [Alistipes sp.]|nr:hypothetical protein [Alistipes sp.]
FGTFEFDYNPADVYLSTMVNDDVDSYKAGIDVAYRIGKQAFHVQIVNSDATQFAREDYKNKGLGGPCSGKETLPAVRSKPDGPTAPSNIRRQNSITESRPACR